MSFLLLFLISNIWHSILVWWYIWIIRIVIVRKERIISPWYNSILIWCSMSHLLLWHLKLLLHLTLFILPIIFLSLSLSILILLLLWILLFTRISSLIRIIIHFIIVVLIFLHPIMMIMSLTFYIFFHIHNSFIM